MQHLYQLGEGGGTGSERRGATTPAGWVSASTLPFGKYWMHPGQRDPVYSIQCHFHNAKLLLRCKIAHWHGTALFFKDRKHYYLY